jgi:hypothetical protein
MIRQTEPPVDTFFKSVAATVKTFSPYHQNIFKPRIFATISEVEMTGILQVTQPMYTFFRIFFWLP